MLRAFSNLGGTIAISEIVGAMILVGVVVVGVALAGILLLSNHCWSFFLPRRGLYVIP